MFELSVRRKYEHRKAGTTPMCSTCRRPGRQPPDEADRRYWLERFTLDEIRELATAIWG